MAGRVLGSGAFASSGIVASGVLATGSGADVKVGVRGFGFKN